MTVPFLDLPAHHAPLKGELQAAVLQVMESAAFAGGPFVEGFERAFAAWCGTGEAVGVGSGTEALWLALRAVGVGHGDEVVTSPASFLATAEAISMAGATPVFVDIDPHTYTLDPRGLDAAITPRTKAIIPVHLHGQTADMDPILAIARERGLFVIEDACQAHGADYKGRRAGTLGDLGCFSFYPGKNLGAFGDAGAVVTQDQALAARIRRLRDHGQSRKYHHLEVGWNCRMDGIQAAVLSVKLRHLDFWNRQRRQHAALYRQCLQGVDTLVLPTERSTNRHVYHVFALRVPHRDAMVRTLTEAGVGTSIHYPVPIHLQEAYRGLGYASGDFPIAERAAHELISLPMFPELTEMQVHHVADCLRQTLAPAVAA
jgi:dTDP-4-amino-4,6-dideoxygalactose transaminase